MCPGSDDETLDLVLPTLEKVAAKAPDGTPCVARIGSGGAGHYVKMIHNGIEHGMMSAVAESFNIMTIGLGMSYDEIADTYEAWNNEGELVSAGGSAGQLSGLKLTSATEGHLPDQD